VNETTNNGGAQLEGKKMLFTASTMSHIENFHLPYIHAFEEMGWKVDAVALPVSKSFFSLKNLRAINYARKLLKDGDYDVISSHATLAGIVTRLAVLLTGERRKHMKIFHTSHGYLFHDDHSLKKWAYLLPEMICGKVTDVLMVMNHEDLEIAKKYNLCGKSNKIYYINGMGIDLSKFQPRRATAEQRAAFGIKEDDFVFVYAAEFSKRKNHELLLRGFAKTIEELKKNSSATNLKLVLAGDGALFDDMKSLAVRLGIESQVLFLGYTKNMSDLYPCCDVAVSTSRIEGLPFNIMEAMACGLPVIASDIKGHKELIEHGENGLLFESGDVEELVEHIIKIYKDPLSSAKFSETCSKKVVVFSMGFVLPTIIDLY
jgi:Glycosyltransferase